MKKPDWKAVVILCMAVLLVVCYGKISTLSSQNQHLRNDIAAHANELDILHDEISSIFNNVDEQLKKEASLITGMDYSLGELSDDKRSTALNVSLVPKVVSDDMQVSVTVDGNTAELTRNGNFYEGAVDVGLFVDYDKWPLLTIETTDGIKTEYLEGVDISYMFSRFLPSVYADMSGSGTHTKDKLSVDLRFSIDCKPAYSNSAVTFTSFTLIEEVNGEEIGREDITDEVMNLDGNYKRHYTKSFKVSVGDELKVYVVAEDSLGYIHKTLAHHWFENDDGAVAETIFGGESIYDKDGNLLYGEKH